MKKENYGSETGPLLMGTGQNSGSVLASPKPEEGNHSGGAHPVCFSTSCISASELKKKCKSFAKKKKSKNVYAEQTE